MADNFPRLTIIIPTLNRCETLYWAIKTVVEQDYQNLSIIVSDNCSDDKTYEVVQQFTDKRLTYIKTPQRFTMLGHFEYALNYVKDGYISFIGDDDGFLPGGVQQVAKVISKYQPKAVGWKFGNYNWPGLPGYFMIPMSNYYRVINAGEEIKNIFTKKIYDAIQFPSLYGGFIDISFVNELKSKYGGVFFHSRIPDFFSGSFIAAHLETYIRLEYPITLNATSKHSAGYATVSTSVDQKPFDSLRHDEGNVPFHPSLKFIRCNVVPVADALLQVNRLVPSFPKLDIKKVIREVIPELAVEPDENKYKEIREGLIEMGKINGISEYVEEQLANMQRNVQPHVVKEKFSPISIVLYVNAEKAGITNVYEAASFSRSVISGSNFRLYHPLQRYLCAGFQWGRYLIMKFFSQKKRFL